FEMLTGAPPFAGRAASDVLAAHVLSKPQSVLVQRQNTPKGLVDLIDRCLAKQPTDRPASADEIIGVLDTLAVGAPPPRFFGTVRGRVLAGGLALALLVPVLAYRQLSADQ